ncbi:MAG: NAD(P)/FAD-dependent oxidoreductase [Nitrospirae bacterium]|nr:NAD(P)/FAD-dependent oxidoreductase [Nitrospirota bacterium]
MTKIHPTYDVAVIGGGPAGMMAAGRAAELGARVVLVEGSRRPGTKLLMTGNGRCNLTNTGHDTRGLVAMFGAGGKFLLSAFTAFGVEATIAFFEARGVRTKTEPGGRVFPVSDRAADVLASLTRYMSQGGVTVMAGARVTGLDADGGRITRARLSDGGTVEANNFIVCTGGRSFPRTGSDGAGHGWLSALGHTVTALTPALAPLKVSEPWVRELEGASLSGAGLTLSLDGKKALRCTGEVVFTRNGISGPAALNISGTVGGLAGRGPASLAIDLMPDTDVAALDAKLQALFREKQNRTAINCVTGLLTPKLAPVFLKLSGIDADEQVNRISRARRLALVRLLKGLPLTVTGVGGFDRAMVTRGGVSLKEVDGKTMRSKLVENLYLAGEVLDLDGPSGGYNLQMCWSTGYVAGCGAGRQRSSAGPGRHPP